MAKRRDWFAIPQEGFYIVDTQKTPMGMNDASRPFAVMERSYRGYRSGFSTSYHGRYTDLDAAKRRIRFLETGR
jgi:hypothetical protein